MYRKSEEKILSFILETPKRENSNEKKCLLIDGLRQVGKTYSIRKVCGFSKQDFNQLIVKKTFPSLGEVTCIYLPFDRFPEIVSLFDKDINTDDILKQINGLSAFRNEDLSISKEHRLLLILDEIQFSKKAITHLKYLAMIPGLTVIASGSMLGILKNNQTHFPIGYVDILRMYPMDFEEFLLAQGFKDTQLNNIIDIIKKGEPLLESLHEELCLLFKHYVLLGGLPFFVDKYRTLKYDPTSLYLDANSRTEEYRNDIAKYADTATKFKGIEVFNSILSSLGKDASKYFYSTIKQGAKKKDYDQPLLWLINCGMVYKIDKVKALELPLTRHRDEEEFKLYYADNLMIYGQLGPSLYEVVMNDLPSLGKGVVYENVASSILYPLCNGKVFYYTRKTGLEIDYVLELHNKIAFVEIKSSLNTKSKSLKTVMTKYPNSIGLRFSYKNNGRMNNLYSLPLYMLPFIDRIVE